MNLHQLTTYYAIYDNTIMKYLQTGSLESLVSEYEQTDAPAHAYRYYDLSTATKQAQSLYTQYVKTMQGDDSIELQGTMEGRELPELSVREIRVSPVGNIKMPIPASVSTTGAKVAANRSLAGNPVKQRLNLKRN